MTDAFRDQILKLVILILLTWSEYARRKVNIESQDIESSINIHTYIYKNIYEYI